MVGRSGNTLLRYSSPFPVPSPSISRIKSLPPTADPISAKNVSKCPPTKKQHSDKNEGCGDPIWFRPSSVSERRPRAMAICNGDSPSDVCLLARNSNFSFLRESGHIQLRNIRIHSRSLTIDLFKDYIKSH